MKKLRLLFSALALLLCSISLFAHDFEVDGIYYKITSNKDLTVEVTCQGTSGGSYSNEYAFEVIIPNYVDYNNKTYSVIGIGAYAFYNCEFLTSVTVPNSVTNIGNRAFDGCTNLMSVNIPDNVTGIGDAAFEYCI